MLSGRLEQIFAIFDAALERPECEQDEFLAEACRDDPQLRDEVDSLLAAHNKAAGFLSGHRHPGQAQIEQTEFSSPAIAPGTRLGVFAIESFVSAGGMGEVYRARDTRLDRSVAIKVLPPAAAADPRARARFTYEARAIARLSHPRICALHDVGHQDGVDFLVMEYLEGETLAVRLSRKALSLREALRTAIEIAEALVAAHSSGIVHRDLKPGNVMLTASGVKLLDFGLARLRGQVGGGPLPMMSGVPLNNTGSGVILGTLQVHGARTAGSQRRGRTRRYLCIRRGAVRDGHGPQGVRRQESGDPDLSDPLGAPRVGNRGATRFGPRHPDVSGKGSPRPLDEHA